ncbi:phospholipase D family protein [Phosphitispora fastidiosa]|uniref:phospholipase D family protein n=1 Tax=Phosphitispora fastidiosa TaxID=2837202 RepID=UPI001E5A9FBF|nr:phospholipase D family protein [Phosphitispora fastidiosa]
MFNIRQNSGRGFKKWKTIVVFLLLFTVAGAVYGTQKPLPEGVSVAKTPNNVSDVEFLYDLTYMKDGQKVHDQEIFDRALEIIGDAQEYIVVDMFLFNDEYNRQYSYPALSSSLADALIEKKRQHPETEITVITDEINTFYGSYPSKYLERMKDNGIRVTITDLTKIRDSNPAYSGFWRVALQWFGSRGKGWLPNAFSPDSPEVTMRSYLKLLNFKANHRKVIVTDSYSLVTSANPHDASAYHSNIAFVVAGGISEQILESETAVTAFSGNAGRQQATVNSGSEPEAGGDLQVSLLTEGKIKKHLIDSFRNSGPGDMIQMGMFYLGERDLIVELLKASERGTDIRLVLDPNKDAFGMEKNGIPNRPVASELNEKSQGRIKIRWYDTHGEQYHTKIVMIQGKQKTEIYGGSANLTRRNIGDYNLETDLKITAPNNSDLAQDAAAYFETIWNNQGGEYTLDFEKYRDDSKAKYFVYRLQEWSGLSSF